MRHFKNLVILLTVVGISISCSKQERSLINTENLYPWCIVAFDSLQRTPEQRIDMIKDLGFDQYAYDCDKKYLDGMEQELLLAKKNQIEIISVWFWLNAKRDSLHQLSPTNQRILNILERTGLETTLWVSFNNNFFKDQSQEESLEEATDMIRAIYKQASKIGCKVAIYNHKGWFGDPDNMVEVVNALPECNLSIVYNFHHAHADLLDHPRIIKKIAPYLSAVNLNGMREGGPKILTVGEGNYERKMVEHLIETGFDGPWGVLGHLKNEDARVVLERNLAGIRKL